MGGGQTGFATAQSLRARDILSDAPRNADRQICAESLPHTQLRDGRRQPFEIFINSKNTATVVGGGGSPRCAMVGGMDLHKSLCRKLKLDPKAHGLQTTKDGKFSVEFAECLASCGTGPVMMCNNDFYEAVDDEKSDEMLDNCK